MGHEPRTLILSDTHLGRGGRLCADALRPLWRGFGRVVFNGDTAELQMPRLRDAAAREVGRLRAMAAADGVELVLICGNHDALISETQYLTLMGGRVLVTHGHALHPAVAPWTSAADAMAAMSHERLSRTPAALADCIDHRMAVARRVSLDGFALDPLTHRAHGPRRLDVLAHPRFAFKAWRYWRQVPRLAAGFAERYCPSASVVVVGHSHRQGVWQRGGRRVINTGCYGFPGRPRAVVVDGDTLAVHDVRWRGASLALADRARLRLDVPAASEAGRARRGRAA